MDRKRDLDALIESTMAFVKDVKREPIPVCLPLWQQSNEHLQTHLNQRAFFWCEHFDFSRRGFPLLRFLRAEKSCAPRNEKGPAKRSLWPVRGCFRQILSLPTLEAIIVR